MLLRLLRLLNKKVSQFMLFCCGLVFCLFVCLLLFCCCCCVVCCVMLLLLLFSSSFYLKSLCRKSLKKLSAIPSCSRYLAGVILKLRLNSWSTKYPQNVNALSVKYILLLLLPQSYFKKMGMTLLLVTM